MSQQEFNLQLTMEEWLVLQRLASVGLENLYYPPEVFTFVSATFDKLNEAIDLFTHCADQVPSTTEVAEDSEVDPAYVPGTTQYCDRVMCGINGCTCGM